jgi:hypothetical protein
VGKIDRVRLGEILLCVANAAALAVLCAPLRGRARQVRYLAVIPPLATVAQVIVEGYRWQMIPAYALSGAVSFWWALQVARPGRRSTWGRFVGMSVGIVV